MERIAVSLCANCIHCPEVVIEADQIKIGEAENTVRLKKDEWNVLVDLISSGQLSWAGRDVKARAPG